MLIAFTRHVSPSIGNCELTYLNRVKIDISKAAQQHQSYEICLRRNGVQVISLPSEPMLPDAVFVEDAAVVVDEVAVVARMGAVRRRDEVNSLIPILAGYRQMEYLEPPATLEGGDVVRIGRTLYVGESSRTNTEGIAQLRAILGPYSYDVRAVKVNGCLHLSTGCSYLGRDTVLINRSWIDTRPFEWARIIEVPAPEPWAANSLSIGRVVLFPSGYPQTRAIIEQCGFNVATLDISEFEKAEAGLTCMSLILNKNAPVSTSGKQIRLEAETALPLRNTGKLN